MADVREWTAADEERLRTAMVTLRADVEALPLADARFVRARGAARRRQRLLTWGAAAAAAVVVAGVTGYAVWEPAPTPSPAVPAGPTRSSAPSATRAPAPAPEGLPTLADWTTHMRVAAGALTPVAAPPTVLCGVPLPDGFVRGYSVGSNPAAPSGFALLFRPSVQDGQQVATALDEALERCRAPYTVLPHYRAPFGAAWTTPHAGAGYVGTVASGGSLALLYYVDPRLSTDPLMAGFGDLLDVAQHRLEQAAAHPPAAPSPATPSTGARAVDEQMPVTGVAPLLPSSLFVAASQWSSPALTGSAPTTAGPGDPEGLGAVAPCESDSYLSGVAGRYGVVRVRSGSGSAGYLGAQRVRLFEDVDAASLVAADLARSEALYAKGCQFPNGTVTSTPGPARGTYRLDTVFKDGTATQSQWVGVTAQRTPGAVTTLVLTRVVDAGKAFGELERLLALARQK